MVAVALEILSLFAGFSVGRHRGRLCLVPAVRKVLQWPK
jgi:hypothetical protein